MGGFISLSVWAIVGPEDSCSSADNVVLGIANPGGPPFIAPRSLVGGEAQGKKSFKRVIEGIEP